MSEPLAQETASRALTDALRTSFLVLKVVLVVVLVVFYPLSGVFRVEQHEQAVVQRLGRLRGVYGPGWHIGWPRPIDEHEKVETARVQMLTTDSFWYALTDEERISGRENPDYPDDLLPGRDGYSLTGDGNLLHTRWDLRYYIRKPAVYTLRVESPTRILERVLRASVTAVAHRFRIDDALYGRAEEFRLEVERELRRRLREQAPLGVEVEGLYVTAMSPPRQVRDAFDAVLQAEAERSQVVAQAESYRNRLGNEATAQASRTVSEGEAWAKGEVARANADARRFEAILAQAQQEREVVIPALYLASLRRVLGQVDRFLLDAQPGQTPEIRILLNPESARPKRPESADDSRETGP